MSTTMTQIRDDLWQTRTESPFPGLTTHAYLWRGPNGNILFYSPASEVEFDAIEALGLWRRYGDRDTRRRPVVGMRRRGEGKRAVLT